MLRLGNVAEDSTIGFKFNTNNGAPITLAGTPAVSVYKRGSTTESTAGVTLTVDYDSRTGMHDVAIDLSADAFYSVATDYEVVLTAGTVAGISVVGTVLAVFSIENRFNEVDVTKWNGTAVATPDTAGYPKVTVKSGTGTGELSLSSGAVIVQSGTGTGQISLSSGIVSANVTQFGGSAGTFSGGRPEVNMSHLGGSATPVTNLNTVFNTDFATNYNTGNDQWNVNVTALSDDSGVAGNLYSFFNAMRFVTVTEANHAATSTAFETDDATDAPLKYQEQTLYCVSGANIGVTVRITGYAYTGNNLVELTVDELPEAPADGDVFLLIGRIEQA